MCIMELHIATYHFLYSMEEVTIDYSTTDSQSDMIEKCTKVVKLCGRYVYKYAYL